MFLFHTRSHLQVLNDWSVRKAETRGRNNFSSVPAHLSERQRQKSVFKELQVESREEALATRNLGIWEDVLGFRGAALAPSLLPAHCWPPGTWLQALGIVHLSHRNTFIQENHCLSILCRSDTTSAAQTDF